MIADPNKLALLTRRREVLEMMRQVAASTKGSEEEREAALKRLGQLSRELKEKIYGNQQPHTQTNGQV